MCFNYVKLLLLMITKYQKISRAFAHLEPLNGQFNHLLSVLYT